MHCHHAAQEPRSRHLVFIPQNPGNASSTACVPVRSGSERTDPGQCAQTRPALDVWTPTDAVIVVSSDDDHDRSEEEILGCLYRLGTRPDRRPDAQVRADVRVAASSTVGTSTPHIDLTDPRWRPPSLEIHRRDYAKMTEVVTVKLSLDDSQITEEITCQNVIKQDLNPEPKSSRDPPVFALQSCLPQKPLQPAQMDCSKGPECISNYRRTIASDGSHMAPSLVDNPPVKLEQQRDELTCTEMQDVSYSRDFLHCSTPIESTWTGNESKDLDAESWTDTFDVDSEDIDEISCLWDQRNNTEESRLESFRAASTEDRHYICPIALGNILSGTPRALVTENNEGRVIPQELCHQSLVTVYSAMESNCTESALECLSELLQPGVYPPRDITHHLLHGILLKPECAHHLCVKAFHLLMKAQRHHMADRSTVTWDWELLVSVMADQDHPRQHGLEIVYMLLEYVAQTLEDDFQAKRWTPDIHLSIARAMLSCDRHFSHVRDLIRWLFSVIMEEHGEGHQAARQRDDQIRIVSVLQRMLALAVEVDHSPTLSAAKLSQELFHMLISSTPRREHRMLLLESMQSKLLQCKLLEQLLDYWCPLKTSLRMSLSLLLHFMKNCVLQPDPTDGTERWHKWEELIHILWMLLLSYNKTMRGYMNPVPQQGNAHALVYKQDDRITRADVCDAVDALLSRSKADLGQALPPSVEESVTYLQDHLLDICQC